MRRGLSLGLLEDLAEDVEEQVGVPLLEDERGPQSDAEVTAAARLDSLCPESGHQVVADLAAGGVDGEEGAAAARSRQQVGELRLEGAEALVQHVPGGAHHAQQLVSADDLDHLLEQQHLARVAHPRVEHAVRQIRRKVRLVEVAAHQHLLGEGDHVWRLGQVEVLVAPELAGGAAARLHLVDEQRRAVLVRDLLQALEEGGRARVVAALGLDGLHGDARDVAALLLPLHEQVVHLRQAAAVLLGVLALVLLQRVLVHREAGDGPVEGRHVQFVDGLGVRGGQYAHGPAVECALEGQDGQIWGAGLLVDHARLELLGREVDLLAALLRPVPDEHVLVGVLVGAGAAHHGGELREPLGRHLAEDVVEPLGKVLAREHAQRRTVHQRFHIVRVVQHPQQVWVVVAKWHGRDLRVDVQQRVAVSVNQVVAKGSLVVREELHRARLLDGGQLGQQLPGPRPGYLRLHHGRLRLPGEHVQGAAR